MANDTTIYDGLIVPGDLRLGGTVSPLLAREKVLAQATLQAFTVPMDRWRADGDARMTCGTGITEDTAAICEGRVLRDGGLIKTEIFIDLTGLTSGATAGDIIGDDGVANCPIGRITNRLNGIIRYGQITCLETPATGDDDIDFYGSVVEPTGTQDVAISTMTGEVIMLNNGNWTGAVATPKALTESEPDEGYIYMCSGQTEAAATYTAGQFLLELWGTPAQSLDYVAGTHGTGAPSLQTPDVGGNAAATNYYVRGEIQLPWEYVAGETVKIRVVAGMIGDTCDQSATVDLSVYESDKDATATATDLVATTAVSDNMNNETFQTVDFIITPTSLTGGDILDVLITMTLDDNGDADLMRGCVGAVQLLCDVR